MALAANALTEEAVRDALPVAFKGVQGHTFRIEHLIAIAASVGGKNTMRGLSSFSGSPILIMRGLMGFFHATA